jgi:hypothetical protein
MTFRETVRDTTIDSSEVPATLATEAPVLHDEHEEDLPPVSEEVLTPLPAKGEDPVRLYLKEIGKVPLLTAQQEVQIGRRIEVGQIALRRALAGIPMAVRALLDVGDRLRRGDTGADDVIVLPEGGELEAKEVRPVLLAFARVRRLERKIGRMEESLDDPGAPRPRAPGCCGPSASSGRPSRRPSPRCRSSRHSSTTWSARCAATASG